MQNRVLLAGFGGQGIMLMGQLLGHTANNSNVFATYYPSYGPEMRGGTANCTVVTSTEEIASPNPSEVDILVAMNEPSLVKFSDRVKSGGTIIVNSSQVNEKVSRDDVTAIYLPADDVARSLEAPKSANMVALGAYFAITDGLTVDNFIETLRVQLAKKAAFFDQNKAAVYKGIELAKESVGA